MCGRLRSHGSRFVPANLFLACGYLGVLGGLSLGALLGIAVATSTVATSTAFGSYAASLGGFALVISCLAGTIFGVTIGVLNGVVLALLAHTPILRSRSGISRNRVTGVATVTTCLGSLALLYPLFQGSGEIFVYPPVIGATLLAIPLSRLLRPF